jgi:nucleoside 2-deoxyribosyltransferase
MEKSTISVYLAGPISHCSPRQRSEWRKAAKEELSKRGHNCIDPAEHEVGWSPYTEIIEIDKSDVVVANLWRESIGTVIGIVQARRMGNSEAPTDERVGNR